MSPRLNTESLISVIREKQLSDQLAKSEAALCKERDKNERLLFLSGQMAEVAVKLVGGEGTDFTCDPFEAAAFAVTLRDRTQRYVDDIQRMEEKSNG